jgi:DNA-binding transcriptional ArsR family regulator
MPKPIADEIVIKTPVQLRAISSPARVRILELMMERGRQSVREIAVATCRPPAALYHHMRVLLRARLVVTAGSRGRGREKEQMFAPAARSLRAKIDPASKREREELARVGAAHTRYVLRRFSRALTSGEGVLAGPRRDTSVRHMTLRLTVGELTILNKEIEALVGKWARRRSAAPSKVLSVLLLVGPGG